MAVFREQRVPLGTCPAVVTGTVYVTAPVCSGKWVRVTAVMSEGGQVSGGPAVKCVYVLARASCRFTWTGKPSHVFTELRGL